MVSNAFYDVTRNIASLGKDEVLLLIENLGKVKDENARSSICRAIYNWKSSVVPGKWEFSEDTKVKQALAKSPFITENVQIEMTKYNLSSPSVMPITATALAENPAITRKVQEIFFNQGQYDVTRALCSNPSLLPQFQEALITPEAGKLKGRPSEYVYAETLAANPSLIEKAMLYHGDPANGSGLLQTIAKHQALPESLQLKILEEGGLGDFYGLLEKGLAQNPHATPSVQARLAVHPKDEVREKLAQNPKLVPAAAEILAQEQSPGVDFYLSENSEAQESIKAAQEGVKAAREAKGKWVLGALGLNT